MGSAGDDRRCASIEDTEATTNHRLLIGRITKTGAWRQVVLVFWTIGSVYAVRQQQRVGVLDRRTGRSLVIVAHAQVKRELGRRAKVVLRESSILRKIRLRRSAGCAGAGKVLRVSRWRIGPKSSVRGESVSAAENSREEIENSIEIEIQSTFPVAATAKIGKIIDELHALDSRLAGTEVVATNVETATARGDHRLGLIAVRLAWFFISSQLKTEFVNHSMRDG